MKERIKLTWFFLIACHTSLKEYFYFLIEKETGNSGEFDVVTSENI
jgi:hypothetical protein